MQRKLFLLVLMDQCCLIVCQLHEYHYIKEKKTWTEAQQYCRDYHSDLATVSHMTDMMRLLSKSGENMSEAWIGLYDQTDGNRTWHWSLPGVKFNESEKNWNTETAEPNDVGGTENCVFMLKNLKWGDVSCNYPSIFLCYNDTNASKKFYLIQEEKTWLEAQSYCRKNHTDLVSGLNQLQDNQLKNESSSVGKNQYILIGLFRDTWRWSDGSSFSFRHWNLHFDNQQYNSGQCTIAVFDDEGRWKNENCSQKKPFICYDDKVLLIKEKMNWEDALNHCRTYYHDLVTITNLDEQRWIQEKTKNASTDFVWMGLRYNCTLNFWFWVCPRMSTSKSSDGEMDDCDMSGAMDVRGQHRWFQRNATEEFNFICAKV